MKTINDDAYEFFKEGGWGFLAAKEDVSLLVTLFVDLGTLTADRLVTALRNLARATKVLMDQSLTLPMTQLCLQRKTANPNSMMMRLMMNLDRALTTKVTVVKIGVTLKNDSPRRRLTARPMANRGTIRAQKTRTGPKNPRTRAESDWFRI